jgi:2-polyprenyl-3-methyl-5-hydroxy-6-metoxy-1,4-benzoquinol methylase
VPYERYGRDLVEGQARMNRPMFLRQLGHEWIPAMPDVHERLSSTTPARVADFGCGAGWSSIGIAQAYPNIVVDGFDFDTASIELARQNARDCGVADRVHFSVRDAGDSALTGRYNLVMALECLHDMSDPVSALRTMRRLTAPGGAVLIVDERNADTFTTDADPAERLQYACSVIHCLPAGMAEQPSAGTGTVMRADTLRSYAEQAGYREVEILPLDNFLFRFYRLHP